VQNKGGENISHGGVGGRGKKLGKRGNRVDGVPGGTSFNWVTTFYSIQIAKGGFKMKVFSRCMGIYEGTWGGDGNVFFLHRPVKDS